MRIGIVTLAIALSLATSAVGAGAPGADSVRLGRAKDYIADEQWPKAIAELRAALTDPKEKNKAEALYWLAHSLNQSGDAAAAIETIRRLEREYPTSLWVKPAASLRLDIAIHLGRSDVLWWTAIAPPVPPKPAHPPRPTAVWAPAPPAKVPPPPASTPPAPPDPKAAPLPPPVPATGSAPFPPAPPAPPAQWLPEGYKPDTDLRIQALGILIRTDATHAIPILKDIALDTDDPAEAWRAMFVLMQSGQPEARNTVVQVAKSGPEPVRIAAVRALGGFAGPEIAGELMTVYSTGDLALRRQVVSSFGARLDRSSLFRIVQAEKDPHLKETAILKLAQVGGGEQLRVLYRQTTTQAVKLPIIIGLFNAGAEDDLIRVADQEHDPKLRREAIVRLRLLGTPKAKEYLKKIDQGR